MAGCLLILSFSFAHSSANQCSANQWPNGQRNHKYQANLLVSYKCHSKIQWILLFLALVFRHESRFNPIFYVSLDDFKFAILGA